MTPFNAAIVPGPTQRKASIGLFALALALAACAGGDAKNTADSTVNAHAGAPIPVATAHTLPAGTTIEASIQQNVSSRRDVVGNLVKAFVTRNVVDDAGLVVIPGGSPIALAIAQLGPAKHGGAIDGVIALKVSTITVGVKQYEPNARVGAVPHTLGAPAARQSAVKSALGEQEVILTPGTPFKITLTQPLKISAN